MTDIHNLIVGLMFLIIFLLLVIILIKDDKEKTTVIPLNYRLVTAALAALLLSIMFIRELFN